MREEGTRIEKNGKVYWRVRANYRDEFGRVKQKGFERKTLQEALNARTIWLAKHGRVVDEPLCGTLKELFEQVDTIVWATVGTDQRRSLNLYRSKWEKELGDLLVDALPSPVLTRTLAKIVTSKDGTVHSKSSIDKAVHSIRSALAFAVSDLGWIKSNPATAIRKPKAEGKSKAYEEMTRAEYDRMLALAEPRCQLLLRLQGECGLRPKEAKSVRAEHLTTVKDRWLLRIPKSKTVAGVRWIPVPDSLATMIFERAGKDWEGITDPANHLRHWWAEHSKARMYDLRGWRSDEWRRRGMPDQLRTALLGHTETKFTQYVYETITGEDTLSMFTEWER